MASNDRNCSANSDLHPTAIAGFNEKTASLYDAKRPEYSKETVDVIFNQMNLDNLEPLENLSTDILELGAGTGKFTKSFYLRLNQSVKYTATDPMEGFLRQAKLNCPSIKTTVCSAENLPFPDASVRFVVCAQCFHWFASEASLKEIHRVLVSNGKLLCLWNVRDISIPWIRAASDLLYEYYTEDVPKATSGKWKEVFEKASLFRQLFTCTPSGTGIQGDKQAIVDYFMTISVIASRPENERIKARQRFLDIFDKFGANKPDSEEWIVPFTTEVYGYVKV